MGIRRLLFLFCAALAWAESPRFSFAVLTDIQYADKDTAGKRQYRRSLEKLAATAADLNSTDLAFAIQLGDLVDDNARDLDAILPVYNRIRARKYHVLGNHDFCVGRAELLRRLGLTAAYYDFTVRGWRFIVLDGMDVSVGGGRPEDSPNFELGRRMLTRLKQAGARNAQSWNGAIGEAQRAWLRRAVQTAAGNRERVIVFCHFPVLEASSTPAHLLWNSGEIVRIIQDQSPVAAYMNGHDHNGGNAEQHGIHYVTFPGMVESGAENSYTVVEVYPDRLELHGRGTAPNRVLRLTTDEHR